MDGTAVLRASAQVVAIVAGINAIVITWALLLGCDVPAVIAVVLLALTLSQAQRRAA